MANLLTTATKIRTPRPHKIVVYGVPGIGKTSFACNAPDPIVIGTEDGSSRYGATETQVAKTIEDIEETLNGLLKISEYKSVVVDALDGIESLCDEWVCRERKVKSIEDIGYGKGTVMANEKFASLVKIFEELRQSGRNVVLIAHSHVKTVNDPTLTAAYDRHQLKLREKNSAKVSEWADAVLFATYEMYVKTDNAKSTKGKAYGDGKRVVYTERRPAWDAKNRDGLPLCMELSWAAYEQALNRPGPEIAQGLRDEALFLIDSFSERDPGLSEVMKKTVLDAGQNVERLREISNRIKMRIEQ